MARRDDPSTGAGGEAVRRDAVDGPADEPGDPGGSGAGGVVRARRSPAVLVGAAALALVVLVGGWLGVRVLLVRDALADARGAVAGLEDAARAEDLGAARTALSDLRAASARAVAQRDVVWRAAEGLPLVGPQLGAVGTVAGALDAVAQRALPEVLTAGEALLEQGGGAADGAAGGATGGAADGAADDASRLVDPDAVAALAPALTRAAGVAVDADAAVAAVRRDGLVGPVAEGVGTAGEGLHALASGLDRAATAARVLPGMLGADGPRTYLVVSQNLAEPRSLGGIVGAVREVRVEDGRLTVGDQLSTSDLPGVPEPVLPLSEEEVALFGDGLGRYVQNATMTPDFPRAAALVAAHWARQRPGAVDGVVAADPVALSYLLAATGPVPLPDGTSVGAPGVVDELLRTAYRRFADPADADGWFAQVSASVLAALGGGAGGVVEVAGAGARAAAEGRLLVWSADPAEQAELATTEVGGVFLVDPAAAGAGAAARPDAADEVAVLLNDSTGGKLGAWLSARTSVERLTCRPDGTGTATVRVDLAHRLAAADLADLPAYVQGPVGTRAPGVLTLTLDALAPVGATLEALEVDGAAVTGTSATLAGRGAQAVGLTFAPGESRTVRLVVPVSGDALAVRTTPTATDPGRTRRACG
ncbi:DUF4012 domain-containing protein [Cellulomonas endophytica]|uniref:DUF4012 domain-containing protein n=1 Tax=Cellulomonas endophytica TaxID=2494735 RepID=UPI001012BA78|nr:DUF4012 domain-containing protein [Cellulomonas endophytica]